MGVVLTAADAHIHYEIFLMFIFTVNDNKLHLTAITSKIPPLLLATFIMCHHIIYNDRVIENNNK